MANDAEFRLARLFYSRDISRIWRVAEPRIHHCRHQRGHHLAKSAGEIGPFGGMKESGIGLTPEFTPVKLPTPATSRGARSKRL
jgi:acyl-CoA reductase-like NAD-dependent aldehyde dehydrogenase